MEWSLDFISEEDFKNHVRATIMKYGEKLESYDLKRFNSNLIDPIKLIFDKSVYRTSWEEIVNNEIFRQRDKSNNNEKVTVLNDKGELEEVFENLNTQPVKRGQKFYYQVWLDTTKFDAANKDNIQTVGITDNYDKDKLTVNASDIKVYDSVTGADVTNKFDITDNNGVLTANLKAGFTKSLGDAENTQIIDTTKFEFGRYYKFDIPATVKNDVPGGADIENTAAQVVNYYNPVSLSLIHI